MPSVNPSPSLIGTMFGTPSGRVPATLSSMTFPPCVICSRTLAVPPTKSPNHSLPELPEPIPMLDVHPPHHAASTWRDFFIHIITSVIGLLIAVGLEQAVEYLHQRHQLEDI